MLIDQLLKDNGIGKDWAAILAEDVFNYEGQNLSKSDTRKKTLLFVNQWENVTGQGDEATVEKQVVVEFLQQMRKWAKSKLHDEERASQFNAIVGNCETMLLSLEDEPETIGDADMDDGK